HLLGGAGPDLDGAGPGVLRAEPRPDVVDEARGQFLAGAPGGAGRVVAALLQAGALDDVRAGRPGGGHRGRHVAPVVGGGELHQPASAGPDEVGDLLLRAFRGAELQVGVLVDGIGRWRREEVLVDEHRSEGVRRHDPEHRADQPGRFCGVHDQSFPRAIAMPIQATSTRAAACARRQRSNASRWGSARPWSGSTRPTARTISDTAVSRSFQMPTLTDARMATPSAADSLVVTSSTGTCSALLKVCRQIRLRAPPPVSLSRPRLSLCRRQQALAAYTSPSYTARRLSPRVDRWSRPSITPRTFPSLKGAWTPAGERYGRKVRPWPASSDVSASASTAAKSGSPPSVRSRQNVRTAQS